MTDVYVVITEDRHTDTDAKVFAREADAVAWAEAETADLLDGSEHPDLAQELNDAMTADSWVRYIPYSLEGDNIRVVKRELQ